MEIDSIIDISEWPIQDYFNTRGTRDKWVVEDEYGFRYYFKKSKEQSGYIHEFWSEIIAYQLGVMLNFPVLRYEAAVSNFDIGCISKSMIRSEENLIEGLQLIQAYDPSFNVYDKLGRNRYSYQLIEKTLVWMGWSMHMVHILQTIIFDAIIGNQDRHQENWGFVINFNRKSSSIKDFADILNLNKKGYSITREGFSEYRAYMDVTFNITERFAPIYDSGSSLGRELTDNSIKRMLLNPQKMLKYIERGRSEIRWVDRQVTHFELLNNLFGMSGYIWFDDIIKQVNKNYNENQLYAILDAVDQAVPDSFKKYKLSPERKELILQLVSLRIKYLTKLFTINS